MMRTKAEILTDCKRIRRDNITLPALRQVFARRVTDDVIELLTEVEKLRELSQRLEETEYGMVAGNLVRDPIPWRAASNWFYYVRTGKEKQG